MGYRGTSYEWPVSVDVPLGAPPSLEQRIPNAGGLVGRDDERARAAEALEKRACLLAGPDGFGKTALALALANSRDADEVRRGLVVRFEEARGGAFAVLLRELMSAAGLAAGELRPRPSSELERAAHVIDLAEATRPLILVEDIHHLGLEGASELVRTALSHSRATRWIFTSRDVVPDVDAATQVILGPLALPYLLELAARWAPQTDDKARSAAARAANGSPWRLGELLRGRAAAEPLDPALEQACALLARFEHALPRALLPFDEALFEALRARGLLEARGSRWRLHDVARAQALDAEVSDAALDAALARLAESPDGALDALSVFVQRDEAERACAVLDDHGERLLSSGYAPELAALVPVDVSAPLAQWGLRIAAAYGAPEPMRRAPRPPSDAGLDARLAWLEVVAARERHADTLPLADALAEDADAAGRGELACRARLFGAAAAMAIGQLDAATGAIDAMRAPTPTQAAHGESVRAMVLAMQGQTERCLRITAGLVERLPRLPVLDRPVLAYNIGIAYHMAKRPLEGARVLERLFTDDALAMASLTGRRALEMDAHFAVLLGRFERARALADRVRRFVERDSAPENRLTLMQAQLDFLTEPTSHSKDTLRVAMERARSEGLREDLAFATQLAAQRAWMLDLAPPPACAHGTLSGRVADAWRALAALSFDGSTGWSDDTRSDELEAVARLLDATRDALAAKPAAPREPSAREEQTVPRRLIEGLVHETLGFVAGADATDASVHGLAVEVGASEVAACLTTLELVREGQVDALVAQARQDAGWARAVLGGEARGALRRKLVERAHDVLGWTSAEGRLAPDGLLVDERRAQIHGPTGSVSARPSSAALRILRALGGAPKGLDKESLCRTVWSVDEYHPLRHDNRLRVAVRKLRRRLEQVTDASTVETLEDGYVLATPLRWMSR